MQLIVNNDEMLGRTSDKTLHLALIEKDKEIERLNNVIDELEKFFKYEFDNEVRPLGSYKVSVWTICLDKLKELKEGK